MTTTEQQFIELKREQLKQKAREMGTIPYGYKNKKESKSLEEQLEKEGTVHAVGFVTFLDGTRLSYEIVAKKSERHLYVYRNFKKTYIVRVDGMEFREIVVEREVVNGGPTWKSVNGRMVKTITDGQLRVITEQLRKS